MKNSQISGFADASGSAIQGATKSLGNAHNEGGALLGDCTARMGGDVDLISGANVNGAARASSQTSVTGARSVVGFAIRFVRQA